MKIQKDVCISEISTQCGHILTRELGEIPNKYDVTTKIFFSDNSVVIINNPNNETVSKLAQSKKVRITIEEVEE